ncbi:hypothetical protein AAC387_Pa04g0490 [Persea americana]|eukprot:TRINITY_DN36830_c0_g2_i1.p1 TRINITY_DN36830_c0_g2~~TRINITY_DN36830_c0_g2_i1.p1  ORF type:complete len:151 (-),score=15.04 TRINITY_DN36830_c0_g2_i1:323-775(-)
MSSVYELSASLRPRLRRCVSMGSEGGNGDWTVGKLKKCKSFPATRDTKSSNFSIQAKIKKFKTLKLVLYAAFQFLHTVGLENEDATTQETNINNGEQRNTFVGLMSRDVPFDDGISNSDTDPNIPFYYMPWVMGAVIYLLGLLFLFHWIG